VRSLTYGRKLVCHNLAQLARRDDQIMTLCAESSDIKWLLQLA